MKTTRIIKINYSLQRNFRLCCYPLKRKKTEDYSWFYCKQVQEMSQRTLPEAVLHQGQGDKGEVLPRLRYKKPEFF